MISKKLIITFLVCMFTCVKKPTEIEFPINSNLVTNMKFINSKNHLSQVGSSDINSNFDERPKTITTFTYSFYMDTSEVTNELFNSIMGKKIDALNNNLPVCNVTWFDAVYFCNSRSKFFNLDTVYTYDSIIFSSNGKIINMVGFNQNLSKLGYRLPTEAEWEFVARDNSDDEYCWESLSDAKLFAWYDSNSDQKIHPVCTKLPNNSGVYDLFGNALEWVNDIKNIFPGGKVANFVGNRNSLNFNRCVKGGSFKNAIQRLRISCRSDVYDISASTSHEYLGFRCVLGQIFSPNFSEDSIKLSENGVITIQNFNLSNIIGRYFKIAFINKSTNSSTVCIADFTKEFPNIFEFKDRKQCYLPSISPDGNWVLFATENFGSNRESHTYLRKTIPNSPLVELPEFPAHAPKWWVDESSQDTFIIYSTSGKDNNDSDWNLSETKKILFKNGSFSGPSKLLSDGSFNAGMSANGEFVSSGYTKLKMKNLHSGELKTLFTGPTNGKSLTDTSQVCNVSCSPSTDTLQNCVLHLDFGYPKNSTVTGSSYRLHEVIFITNYENSVVNWYRAPTGFVWDHPRWSNNVQFAAAVIQDNNGLNPSIYIIDLFTKKNTNIIDGLNLWQPFLWIGNKLDTSQVVFNIDSMGEYNNPPSHAGQEMFNTKMKLFWKYCQDVEVVFLGNSLVYCGIDCKQISHFKSINMAYTGSGINSFSKLINGYILSHSPNIKAVVVCTPFYFFSAYQGDGIIWDSTIGFTKGYVYDKNNNFWKSLSTKSVQNYFTQKYPVFSTAPFDSLGLYLSSCNGWGTGDMPIEGPTDWTIENENFKINYKNFKALAETLSNHNIHFLSITFPENPAYKNSKSMFRGGTSWETGKIISDSLISFTKENQYFHYYDAYKFGNHDYLSEDFLNPNHLCPNGAAKISKRIDSLLFEIIQ